MLLLYRVVGNREVIWLNKWLVKKSQYKWKWLSPKTRLSSNFSLVLSFFGRGGFPSTNHMPPSLSVKFHLYCFPCLLHFEPQTAGLSFTDTTSMFGFVSSKVFHLSFFFCTLAQWHIRFESLNAQQHEQLITRTYCNIRFEDTAVRTGGDRVEDIEMCPVRPVTRRDTSEGQLRLR